MVTRKSHSRKEKKAMATFGQFILPLTVVMAAALMFFSVKLFFLDPHDVKITDNANVSTNKSYSEPVPQHTDDEIEKLIKEQDSPKKTTVKEPVVQSTKKKKTVDSQNKDVIKSEQKRTEQKQTEPPKTKPVQIVVKKTVKSADVSDNRQKQTAP
ncbi:MAG: hypothetical protein RR214_02950, partial [Synergistaceae bacterium]